MFILATTSLRPVLTDLGLSEAFDSELRVPPISNLHSLEYVLQEVELFPSDRERQQAIKVLEQAGLGGGDDDEMGSLNIGIKKLLSVIEMARQEPDSIGERLTGALMGLGM